MGELREKGGRGGMGKWNGGKKMGYEKMGARMGGVRSRRRSIEYGRRLMGDIWSGKGEKGWLKRGEGWSWMGRLG
jgi:hypothetical protein